MSIIMCCKLLDIFELFTYTFCFFKMKIRFLIANKKIPWWYRKYLPGMKKTLLRLPAH